MAGGMRSRPGPTLAERSATAGIGAGDQAPLGHATPEGAVADPPPPPARSPQSGPVHCWVRLPDSDEQVPGLLTAWRREASGWAGQVAYAVREGDDSVLIQAWVPARHLQPR